jgi:hypothetical protein
MRRPTLEARLSSLEANPRVNGQEHDRKWCECAMWVLRQDESDPNIQPVSTLFSSDDIQKTREEFNRFDKMLLNWTLNGEGADRVYDELSQEVVSMHAKMIAVGMI